MKRVALILLLAASTAAHADPMRGVKQAPSRPPEGPAVRLADIEVLPDCPAGKVCALGMLESYGTQTAHGVRLRVELGGIKIGKPRAWFYHDLPENVMNPGDMQEFSLMINRKFPYRNAQKKDKILEVGRYNFRVIPVWRPKN